MLGFLTLVLLAVAIFGGGIWWAAFVFMFFVWLGVRHERRKRRKIALDFETHKEVRWDVTVMTDGEAVSVTRQGPEPTVASRSTPARSVIAINSAPFEDLLTLPGIGAAEAQLIIKRREEAKFRSSVELVDYLKLQPHIARRLEGRIDYEAPHARRSGSARPKAVKPASGRPGSRGRVID